MPRVSGEMIEHLREHGHLLESPQTYSFPFLPKVAHTDFPESFSLTSQLYVSLDISGNEILAMSSKRVQITNTYLPVFEECARLPEAPKDPARIASEEEVKAALERNERHPLIKKTSILTVDTRKEAHCVELQRYLDSSTISCIRGLTGCLRLDLSLFSTKAVVEAAGNQELEVRTQYQLPPETNCDHASQPTWKCISDLTYTSINEYSHYQAESFKHTLKGESEKMRKSHTVRGSSPKRMKLYKRAASPPKILKTIKFGTNIDLSDDTKWKAQINVSFSSCLIIFNYVCFRSSPSFLLSAASLLALTCSPTSVTKSLEWTPFVWTWKFPVPESPVIRRATSWPLSTSTLDLVTVNGLRFHTSIGERWKRFAPSVASTSSKESTGR